MSRSTTTSASFHARTIASYDVPAGVQTVEFEGPHPAGNAGWHIHRLMPAVAPMKFDRLTVILTTDYH